MSFSDLPKPAKNMMLAGYMFMNTTWIQNQMVYLIILSKNRHLIDEFVSTPKVLPGEFVRLRNKYWARMFADIKNEFLRTFQEHLSADDINYIEKIYMLRNMLAHAQVTQGKDHMFYRPKDEQTEKKFLEIMEIIPGEDSATPYLIVIDYNNQGIYDRTAFYIERVGVDIMGRLAAMLNVPHAQVR